MDFFDVMNVSASGMTSQRTRMETISSNLANAQTTRTPEGGPYRRRDVVFETVEPQARNNFGAMVQSALKGVKVSDVVVDQSPLRQRFEPSSPDADAQGYVYYPNVDAVTEMVNMVSATRSYEANLSVIEATKSLMLRTLEI